MSPILSGVTTVVFYDPDYPGACSYDTLTSLVPGEFRAVRASELADGLEETCSLLISFHGSYFPKPAWEAILHFLERGGNLAVFGGMPFTQPVRADGCVEPEQQAFTDQLYLGPIFPIEQVTSDLRLEAATEAAFLKDQSYHLPAEQVGKFWSFYPKLTQVSDQPQDTGSAGPFDTLLTPLIFAKTPSVGTVDTERRLERLATPALLLDQQSGRFKGGRWLLSPWQPASEQTWLDMAETLRQLIALTSEGTTILETRPLFACYQPGEAPTLLISARTHHDIDLWLTVYAPDDTVLDSSRLTIGGTTISQELRKQLPTQRVPGLYRVEVSYQSASAVALRQETGFWIWDEQLVASTTDKLLTPGRDYFYQDGQPFPILGTTYMDSRVQRRFLALPNPARWDHDFAEMRAVGISMIRTGIWSGWRGEIMPLAGVAHEATLRAFDAFVMTACKHNLQVVFTFFAFYPPLFEGSNPWLDPRSISGQQDLVLAFVRRYTRVKLLSWDLINEPSFGDPKAIFSQRPLPNYDRYETAAFRKWLAERYTLDELRLRWRLTPTDLPNWSEVVPPLAGDYSMHTRNNGVRDSFKVMDYTHFSQQMFAAWAATMYETIRAAGGETLVGVGQDEAGARISPQFYASAVDYTTTHPWWNIDDLLWDMLLDKTIARPNVIQETGVMLVRDVDKRPWHSEQENAELLERKLITGLAARSAGVIQWLWHINGYMTSENENSIGLVRCDGSEKPELAAMREFGRLMQALEDQLTELALPDVWVVTPYSQWFLRPDLSIEATRRAIRVLGYDCSVIPQVVAEQQLPDLVAQGYQPRTIIVPGVQYFEPQGWQALDTLVARGTTLLVSGVLTRDPHNLAHDAALLTDVDADATVTPAAVSRYEYLQDEHGAQHQLHFGHEKTSYVRKAHNRLDVYEKGEGKVFWSGLPLELAQNNATLREVYRRVLGLKCECSKAAEQPLLVVQRPIADGMLILAVSESAQTLPFTVDDHQYILAANRAGAIIVRSDGTLQCFGGATALLASE